MAQVIPCKWCGKPYRQLSRGAATAKGHAQCYRDSLSAAAKAVADLKTPAGGYASSVPSTGSRHEHPKGWEPHVEETANTATAISQPLESANPDEAELIRGWNLDPSQWRIVGPLNCRRWQTLKTTTGTDEDGNAVVTKETIWLYYFKANLERIDPIRESEIAELCEEIRKHEPRTPVADWPIEPDSLVAGWADVQMGKADGDGSAGTVGRALASINATAERAEELRRIGRKINTLYVLGMGDLIESCDGHYPQQAWRTELNRRDQVKVMRRLIVKSLERWAPLFERVVVACVGGNHGENRKDGKSFTDFADNDDVAIFEQAQEILAANPAAYGHVSFRIPKAELSMTHDVSGVILGQTHGHLFGKGAGPVAKKATDWWMKQAHGQQPIGDAKILISAHFHHLIVNEQGSKTHIQCPALEGGSEWWRDLSGQESRPGLLTLHVGKNVSAAGWADLQVV